MACILNNILFMRLCPSCFTLNACALNVQYVNNHKSEESELALFTYVICFIRFCRFALNRERERSSEQARLSASVLQVMFLWKKYFCHQLSKDESDIFIIAFFQCLRGFPVKTSALLNALNQWYSSLQN